MGFLPFGFAAAGVHQSRFGVVRVRDTVATGAVLVLRRAFGGGVGGLALQGLLEHSLGERFLNGDEEVFHLGEFGAPGWSARSPDAVHQMFGDAVKVRPHFVDGGGGLFGGCSPATDLAFGPVVG